MWRAILAMLVCSAPAAAADVMGRVIVVDGDTIAVEGAPSRIRIDGIDAPEGAQVCKSGEGADYLCGPKASQALAELIGRNGRVSCSPKTVDRYGRQVAVCEIDGKDIGREMVRLGWAVDYTQYSGGRYAREQADAKAAKRGIWAGTFQMPWDWRAAQRAPTPVAPLPILPQIAQGRSATTSATSCKNALTCRDAVILWCGGYSRADADSDGIPCENVCRSLSQVAPIKKEIGCGL